MLRNVSFVGRVRIRVFSYIGHLLWLCVEVSTFNVFRKEFYSSFIKVLVVIKVLLCADVFVVDEGGILFVF
jgi:hypothetical protein